MTKGENLLDYDRIAVLIPAYKPDERLITLVDALREAGFTRLVAVDDGGGAPYRHIFDALEGKAEVLVHEVNRGKGAALKTGLEYIRRWEGVGVVTADCDGQHAPADVCRIADALLEQPDALILGSRDKRQMPPRSKAGNTLTCGVFALLTGLRISDTQTGLRGLPACALERFAHLEGDRYEYEINMLIEASRIPLKVREVTIETIYIDNNSSSHFNALRDGLRIYRLMFRQAGKFLLSAVACTVLEYLCYTLLVYPLPVHLNGWLAQLIVRAISSPVNYYLNSKMVFERKPAGRTFVAYCLLVVAVMVASSAGIGLLQLIGLPPVLSKLIVDCVLFFVNYRVQRNIIFK